MTIPLSALISRKIKLHVMALVLAATWITSMTCAAQGSSESLESLLSAVVVINAIIPSHARTARPLGIARSGSGVVIDSNGLILTIGYLILESTEVEIILGTGQRSAAQVVAYDHQSGFGLIRAEQALIGITPMKIGTSANLTHGDPIIVASFGGPKAMRPAVVVSRRTFTGYWEYLLENAIFTTPAHPLHAGAALISPGGKLIGIGSLVVADAFPGRTPVPGNMFVPIDRLNNILGDLLIHGRSTSPPPRPWLGLYSDEAENQLIVRSLAETGPAEQAGISVGDIIIAVEEQRINTMIDFYRSVWTHRKPGDSIQLTVLRDGNEIIIKVRSSDRYDWLRLGKK